ncbi:PREDICTED: rab GTPase-binding effector protein 2 isoform X2 [Nicrophorus vespilloides]|uniref:Rab GTPase-binding effector protein 2 isoform X2 n=1 Tax=Nicrophorus vespilloides TaxID=110193 RepID=A0ABM1N0R1_NICVS|nr:PREDICTED: rab GTPase-binding effector protein 2 isoform X2 [Nicrophorus vespilloides]
MEGVEENVEEKSVDGIVKLAQETKKMRVEFDCQRAKMKELFLQKEDELNKNKMETDNLIKELEKVKAELNEYQSRLLVADMQLESNVENEKRKAAEEIATLQQLVHETVEESSSTRYIYGSEVSRLQVIIKNLETENTELKTEKQQSPHHTVQETSSLAPSVMLSAVTKKLVKKLGADAFTSQDDDHKEDELLKSLLGPLEEEIKALKDKLRSTDDQLQKCKQCCTPDHESSLMDKSPVHNMAAATNTSFDGKLELRACDMCSNYEAQLVNEQKRASSMEQKVTNMEKLLERQKEDLLKEIAFRKDMEEKWNEKREEYKKETGELSTKMECCEQDLKELQEMFNQSTDEMKENLMFVTKDREMIQQELDRLQKQNDNLVGKYTAHSEQLQSEFINLPSVVDELQELLLKSHQDLIIAKIGKEAAEEVTNSLRSEIMLLKDQIESDQMNTRQLENSLVAELDQVKHTNMKLEEDRGRYLENLDRLKKKISLAQERIAAAEKESEELKKLKKSVDDKNAELKSRVASLQQELDNSEAVQKDFVRLSQSLQVQLQKIRDSDAQVRWQHDEDVDDCPSCRSGFTSHKRKEHCKHCGQIFCSICLNREVPSGPHMRPSKVCDVCHTLLVKSSAPYFSKEAPHSPD